jgi:hypothetical protein
VQYFEIWNEENGTQFWSTGPSGSQYATMYSGARAAIEAADPSGQAIVGGLGTGDASAFVRDMFAAMPSLKGNVDGFGLHPYEGTPAADEQDVVAFRATLDSLGESSAPVDLTEFGWTAGTDLTSEDYRAEEMGQVATVWSNSNCGIGVLAPYTWVNDPGDPPDYALSDGTGLLNAGIAWFDGLQAGEAGATNELCPTGTVPTTTGTPAPPASPNGAAKQRQSSTVTARKASRPKRKHRSTKKKSSGKRKRKSKASSRSHSHKSGKPRAGSKKGPESDQVSSPEV